MSQISAFGVDHGYEISKLTGAANATRTLLYDPNLKGGKGPKKGTSYSGEERKKARKIVRGQSLKGYGAGLGAGGAAGAAAGALAAKKFHLGGASVKGGAALGGVGGSIIGSQTGGSIGRSKGIKRYQKEIGRPD